MLTLLAILIGLAILVGQISNHKALKELTVMTSETKLTVDALVKQIDAATDKIAAKIDALANQIAEGGMTPAEEAEVVASLRQEADKLEALGQDANNPVPAVK